MIKVAYPCLCFNGSGNPAWRMMRRQAGLHLHVGASAGSCVPFPRDRDKLCAGSRTWRLPRSCLL